MIPEDAIDEAAEAIRDGLPRLSIWDLAKEALEAALPTLLSHEREETRLAHIDAVVNAATVDRLERELAEAKADGWDEGAGSVRWTSLHVIERGTNPYRT